MEESLETPKRTKSRVNAGRIFLVVAICAFVYACTLQRNYRQATLNADLIQFLQTDAVLEKGSTVELAALLAQGADPNAKEQPAGHGFDFLDWLKSPFQRQGDGGGEPPMTALIIAAGNRHGFGQVKLLVEHGANIHTTGRYGWDPLTSAVAAGNLDSVKYLHERGLSVNTEFNWGARHWERQFNRRTRTWFAILSLQAQMSTSQRLPAPDPYISRRTGTLRKLPIFSSRPGQSSRYSLSGSLLFTAGWSRRF